jgi:hypothetical protein
MPSPATRPTADVMNRAPFLVADYTLAAQCISNRKGVARYTQTPGCYHDLIRRIKLVALAESLQSDAIDT